MWSSAALFAPAGALAQEAVIQDDPGIENEARSLFEAGRVAYDAARYEAALNYFQQAYDVLPRPALLFNVGAAADRLQQNARALEAYRQYLVALPDASNRAAVERRIAFLEALPTTPTVAATTEPVASTTSASSSSGSPTDSAPSGGGDITGEWWFWTLIAALVVGAGVGITVGVVASSPQLEGPLPGDFPATMALRVEY